MLTIERKFRQIIPEELECLPEVEYSDEAFAEMEKIVLEAKAELASGKLIPMTVAEFAAERGIKLGAA